MKTLNPSFRLPPSIPNDAAHPRVIEAITNAANGIVDLNQAIATQAGQIATLMTASSATTAPAAAATTGGTSGSGETIVQNMVSGGPVNNQSGVTTYTTSQMDNGAIVIFNAPTAVAVTLNTNLTTPWYCFVTNLGAGTVTLSTQQGLINGASTEAIPQGFFSIVFFDGTNHWACALPASPHSFVAVAHQFLTAYSATTGLFTAAQPSFEDISGQFTTSQSPGISATITTAKLTTGGTSGSMTFSGGVLTAQTQAT